MSGKGSDKDSTSPECLMTSEPVKDPYSTDEEQETEEKPIKIGKNETNIITTYSGSYATVNTLKKYYNLVFHSIFQGPSHEDLLNLDVSEILEHLLFFVTNKSDHNGRIVMDNILKSAESSINLLHEFEEFHINFKEGNKPIPVVKRSDSAQWQIACKFLRKMFEALELTRELHPIDSGYYHEKMKSCMTALCKLSLDEVLGNSACVNHLQSSKAAKLDDEVQPAVNKTATFKTQPDLVLIPSNKDEDFPGVPFEIYSPKKKVEEKSSKILNESKQKKEANLSSDSFQTENFITDEEQRESLSTFLCDHIPDYFCKKYQVIENLFKSKLVAQHVLQIIGTASNYCYHKYVVGHQMKKDKIFIGFFVCDEYVHMAKIQGDEACFAQYSCFRQLQAGITVETFNLDQRLKTFASFPDPKIHVQFSSAVLDLSIHKHRMALLFLLQYYIRIWDEIESDPLRKDI